MKLTLIRHGQTPSNVAGLIDTAVPGPGLTELGRRQAAAIPEALDGEPIDAIFASSQLRAQQTADPLAASRRIPIAVLPGLREIAAGDLEMAGDADSIHRYIGAIWTWLEGDLSVRVPGGPDGHEVLERFDDAVDTITAAVGEDGAAVAVSHGAVIRVWSAVRAANVTTTEAGGHHLDNTGAVVMERDDHGDWHASSWFAQAIGGSAVDDAVVDAARSGPARSGPAR